MRGEGWVVVPVKEEEEKEEEMGVVLVL